MGCELPVWKKLSAPEIN